MKRWEERKIEGLVMLTYILYPTTASQKYNGTDVLDGNWHHIAISSSLSKKQINVYIDGKKKSPKIENVFKYKQFAEEMRFTLGQEQDSYDNGIYEDQSFVGNITAFNMWDRFFPDDEISPLAKECPSSHRQGNLLNWPDIVQKKNDALNQKYNGTDVLDGNWHHIAISSSLSKKQINVYIDGKKKSPKIENVFKYKQFAEEMRFTLGQEQDSYDNGIYEDQSFVGNITAFNMWDRFFPDDEISPLAKECPSSHRQGNLLNWPDIVQKKNDALKYFCGLSCEDFGLVNQDLRNQEKTAHACFDNQ
ncbi:Sushi, von Willebrand factor type A, EGF and pentraxin domain-containing protein 1 [Exaiptasia diaphana]|nr:Sushi, von Willebrand factor type A, EGF and pentraxin domain-containing protein 1 [Exaiptasia diaphana]